MDTPTVGRAVHFYEDEQGPFAATITRVHSNTCIDLAVLKPQQTSVYVGSSVQHADLAGFRGTYWVWPPRV